MKPKPLLTFMLVCIFLFSIVATSFAAVWVKGYYRKDGTYVQSHYRSNPDGNPYNNWSYPGNTNPYTGKVAPGNPSTYLRNYYNPKSPPKSYSFNYTNQAFEDWLSKIGDTGESGSPSFYSSDTQTIEVSLLKIGDNEESKDEAESISESPDSYQAISKWLQDMRKNKKFEEWLIGYKKEHGEFSQEGISRLYNLRLAMPSATIQEFIEIFVKFLDPYKQAKQ